MSWYERDFVFSGGAYITGWAAKFQLLGVLTATAACCFLGGLMTFRALARVIDNLLDDPETLQSIAMQREADDSSSEDGSDDDDRAAHDQAALIAASSGRAMNEEECVKLALQTQMKHYLKNMTAPTKLLYAAINAGDLRLATTALEQGAPVDDGVDFGAFHPPLGFAIEKSRPDIATLLLDRSADVNLCGKSGNSALFAAVHKSDAAMVRLLVARGADLFGLDRDGDSLVYCAALAGATEMVALLAALGAVVDPPFSEDDAPYARRPPGELGRQVRTHRADAISIT